MTPSSPPPQPQIGALLAQAEGGDARARDLLFATLYEELHRLAQREVRRQGGGSPLSATTLLHEVYLAFGAREAGDFPDEARFLAYAAKAMRGVLIDRVRANYAAKRGGGVSATTLDNDHAQQVTDPDELIAIHDALESLEQVDPMLARVVDLRFFCGFTFAEIAAVHRVAERTVQRQWDKARLFLRHALEGGADH
jgi:RNA polymerase sigma factor (TIGR02999 family)